MKCLAVIPARSGSKRIPNKNIKDIGGLPAIAYPIKLAKASGIFQKIIVSTDDSKIAEISRDFGAQVPFIRRPELSDDHTITVDVIADTARQLIQAGENFDYICCIYPVTPLLRQERLNEAYEILKNNDWDYVFPALEYNSPIQRSFVKNNSGSVEFTNREFLNTRTQDLDKTYYDAGQFYFGKTESWVNQKSLFGIKSTFIQLEKYEVLDVDTVDDWDFLSEIMNLRNQKKIRE